MAGTNRRQYETQYEYTQYTQQYSYSDVCTSTYMYPEMPHSAVP